MAHTLAALPAPPTLPSPSAPGSDLDHKLETDMYSPVEGPCDMERAFGADIFVNGTMLYFITDRPSLPNTLKDACRPLTKEEIAFDVHAIPEGIRGLAVASSLSSHIRTNVEVLNVMWLRFEAVPRKEQPPTLKSVRRTKRATLGALSYHLQCVWKYLDKCANGYHPLDTGDIQEILVNDPAKVARGDFALARRLSESGNWNTSKFSDDADMCAASRLFDLISHCAIRSAASAHGTHVAPNHRIFTKKDIAKVTGVFARVVTPEMVKITRRIVADMQVLLGVLEAARPALVRESWSECTREHIRQAVLHTKAAIDWLSGLRKSVPVLLETEEQRRVNTSTLMRRASTVCWAAIAHHGCKSARCAAVALVWAELYANCPHYHPPTRNLVDVTATNMGTNGKLRKSGEFTNLFTHMEHELANGDQGAIERLPDVLTFKRDCSAIM